MKKELHKSMAKLIFALALVFLTCGIASAQIQAAGGGYYVAGYGTVYGSFGQASAAQSRLYDRMKAQKTERQAPSASTAPSDQKSAVQRPPVVRNRGKFRPDPKVDTGRLLADNLGDTREEKALIKTIYTTAKAEYEKEAAARGFKNNIAGALTFFTVTAATVYHDGEEVGDGAVNDYFKIMNAALDEIPEFSAIPNKDKQGFNNMLIGFSGMLLATYAEGKQNNNAETLASARKLAAMLIELVLKTDPENLRIEDGQIVMK